MKTELIAMLQNKKTIRWNFFMSLDMAAALWYRETMFAAKPGSRNTYITAYMYMASDAIGQMRLRRITGDTVNALFESLRKSGSSAAAVAGLRAALSNIFAYALRQGVIKTDPVAETHPIAVKRDGLREISRYAPEDFLEYAKKRNLQTYIILCFLMQTGLRIGDYHVIIGLNQLETAKYKGFRKIWSYDFLQRNGQNTAERSKNLIRYLS